MKFTLKGWLLLTTIIFGVFLLLLSGQLNDIFVYFWEAFTLNYNVNDLESLSAGRFDVYIEALKYSFSNPLGGEITSTMTFDNNPHNYILYTWTAFGLILSIPLILFYLYLWCLSVTKIFKNRKNKTSQIAAWVLLFLLIISLFEYTYPYGPGVTQLFMWFLLGQYIYYQEEIT